jgi:DNA-binding NarL/FixJ family response regulator
MNVLLVEDHALLRESLALMFGQAWPSVRFLEAGTLAQAVHTLQAHPDVQLVLVDLTLPDAQGLGHLARLRDHAPYARLVVISADDRPQTVLDAIEAGAAGFIPKTTEFRVVLDALQRVLDGGVVLPATLSSAAAAASPESRDPLGALGLSPRQAEVLALLVEGHTNKAICRALGLSPSTVKTHLETIFRRLEVRSRTQAVVAVARLGLRLPARLAPPLG